MLFSNEKEWTADTLHSMDEHQKQNKNSERNQTQWVFTRYEFIYVKIKVRQNFAQEINVRQARGRADLRGAGQALPGVSEVLGPDCGGVRIRVHTFVKTHRALYLSV